MIHHEASGGNLFNVIAAEIGQLRNFVVVLNRIYEYDTSDRKYYRACYEEICEEENGEE
jgi:hypothetical protein